MESNTQGHGTIKKLRTGAVISTLAISALGVSTTVSANETEVAVNEPATKVIAKDEVKPKVPSQQDVDKAKAESDKANQDVAKQKEVVASTEAKIADAEKTIADTTKKVDEAKTVTPEKVAEAKADAQTKSDELAKAEDSVKSAEQSQADTAKKVADQTTVVNQAEANANKTASAVADAQKKVDDLSKSTTDTTKLQKDVDDLTKKVSDDQKSLETAKQSLDTAKSDEANKAKAIENANKAVNDAAKTESSAKQILDTAKSAEANSTKKVEDAKKALDVAKAGTTQKVQTGTKTVTTGGKAILKDGVATSNFFQSNGVITSDAYLKAIKALAEGRGSCDDVRKAIADGLENVVGSSLADIAATDGTVFKSWRHAYNPQFSNTDSTTKVSVHDLTDEQLTDLALFYTALVNDLRSKVGTEPLKVTKESVAVTKKAIKDLFNKTFPAYNNMSEAELKANGFWGPGTIKKVTESYQTQEDLDAVQGSGKLLNDAVANQVQYQGHDGSYQTMADLKANLLAFVGNMLYGPFGTGSNISTAGIQFDNFSFALALLGLRGNYNSVGVGLDFYRVFNTLGYSAPATYALMLNTDGEAIDNPYQTLIGGKTEVVPVYETKTIVDEKAVAKAQLAYDTAVKADQDAKAKLAAVQTKYDTAMKALADAQKRLNDLQSGTVDIPTLEKAVVDAQAQLDSDKASLQSSKETLAVAKASAVDKANALSKAQAELVKAKSENTKAQQVLTQAKEELEVLTKANGVAKQAVESATANRDKVDALVGEAYKKAQDLEMALTNKPTVLKELNAKLAEAQTKAGVLRAELETAKEELSKLQVTAKEKVAKYSELAKLKSEQDKAEADAKRLQDLQNKANEIRKNGGQPKEVLDANGKVVDVVDAKAQNKAVDVTVGTKEDRTYQAPAQATNAKAEPKKQLPNTGTKESNLLAVLGASIGLLALAGKRKYNR
ncbi:TPA: SEC10/PgrA surface exclusion domain-containing protein [Streptococcus agalactiae]|uniref:SEC10/PgrA surface exclusion domain-containing protein n=1 Tax=Streptococcus TaxID=1301 RepID=UPI00071BCBF3|nr:MULTISPECIES: SEC10/PgrA surface exclusion domain-containing protein [Streptococcus]ALP86813.1 peptidase [Streptococcus agalactiae]MCW1055631.1 SEC10/PgrA surface exclusion domain-containing protein [Streptococcus anginosus]NJJ27227.1 SEC10/PgrA surface exclusion domain-containing protein [Streptococcus anginosus]HEN2695234.1 SEC10/PgrA surface exclusion domain-containing protein [Streptococcus agalactiae]HEO2075891.1 SEC10/PgrA surface exclusion domain-containing protein [Streptococcus aga